MYFQVGYCILTSSNSFSVDLLNYSNRSVTVPTHACQIASVTSNSLQPPWTIASQAPMSLGFSRQKYWSALSFPPPGDLPNSGIEPRSLMSPALANEFYHCCHLGSPQSINNANFDSF